MASQVPRRDARASDLRIGPLLGRQLLPVAVAGLVFWILRDRIPDLDLVAVWNTVHRVSIQQWGFAALATLASFWAVGRHDQLLHGLINTEICPQQARQSGTTAIAVAQFAGFGVLSSALVRWRLLPGLSLTGALRISVVVSLSFLAGWSVILALVVVATGVESYYLHPISVGILGLAGLVIIVLIKQPKSLRNLPSPMAVFSVIGFAFFDTIFASVALFVLLPPEIVLTPIALFTAYLVALGCGLIGGTPGGVGPFEMALLTMLPSVAPEPLLASALAFRIIYYLLPASLAFLVLVRGPFSVPCKRNFTVEPAPTSPYLGPALERAFWQSPRAEANLIRQGQFALLTRNDAPAALMANAGQSLVMLADPVNNSQRGAQVLKDFQRRAAQVRRAPVIYKCSARIALAARKLGWHVLPVAAEAWIRPQTFRTHGPNHRQLRRLLRKAERADVRIVEGGRNLPLEDMQHVSDQWANDRGGERGFSMGRFGRDYVSCQRVFLAYADGRLIAFITLHEVQQEWTLDLLRHIPDAPAGTMHLLVCRAIESAAAVNCVRLSLAAIPCAESAEPAIVARLRRRLIKSDQFDGLARFKSSFGPNWSTLYAAAPSRTGLGLGLWAVYSRINRTR